MFRVCKKNDSPCSLRQDKQRRELRLLFAIFILIFLFGPYFKNNKIKQSLYFTCKFIENKADLSKCKYYTDSDQDIFHSPSKHPHSGNTISTTDLPANYSLLFDFRAYLRTILSFNMQKIPVVINHPTDCPDFLISIKHKFRIGFSNFVNAIHHALAPFIYYLPPVNRTLHYSSSFEPPDHIRSHCKYLYSVHCIRPPPARIFTINIVTKMR